MKTVLLLIGCVLASTGPTDTRAAKQATSTIPIVTKAELLVQTGRV